MTDSEAEAYFNSLPIDESTYGEVIHFSKPGGIIFPPGMTMTVTPIVDGHLIHERATTTQIS